MGPPFFMILLQRCNLGGFVVYPTKRKGVRLDDVTILTILLILKFTQTMGRLFEHVSRKRLLLLW